MVNIQRTGFEIPVTLLSFLLILTIKPHLSALLTVKQLNRFIISGENRHSENGSCLNWSHDYQYDFFNCSTPLKFMQPRTYIAYKWNKKQCSMFPNLKIYICTLVLFFKLLLKVESSICKNYLYSKKNEYPWFSHVQ